MNHYRRIASVVVVLSALVGMIGCTSSAPVPAATPSPEPPRAITVAPTSAPPTTAPTATLTPVPPTDTPVPPTVAPPTSVLTASATRLSSPSTPPVAFGATTPVPPSLSRTVYCPSSVADARQAYNDALALESRGQVDAARQSYLKAIELDPNYCDAMDNLGLILRRQNKLDEAASWYKRSIQVYPNNPVARTNLAVVYRLQGKLDDAIAEYRRVTEIAPEDAEGYFGLGSLYVIKGQPQQAIPPLLKAEALYAASSSPLITDARYYLGMAYTMSRQYASGRDYLETIYPEMSDNGLVNYYLGQCYFSPELNDRERALKYFKRAQELGVNLPAEIRQLLANSTPTPTATRPPVSAQPTLTPASMGIAIPTGKPVTVWKGIPIMPQALAGDDDGDGYTFTVNATVAEAQAFYEQAMPAAGWTPFAVGSVQNNTARMMIYRGQGITTSVLIFDQAGVTLVVIVQT